MRNLRSFITLMLAVGFALALSGCGQNAGGDASAIGATALTAKEIPIDSQDSAASVEAVNIAISELDRAASKGVIHRRNAARRKSRLLKKLSTLEKSN